MFYSFLRLMLANSLEVLMQAAKQTQAVMAQRTGEALSEEYA